MVIQLGWDWGSTLFGAFDRCVCLVVVISLAITVHSVNGVTFSPLELSRARAAYESTDSESMPHGNELARNSTSLHLYTITSAQKRAANANEALDLHQTMMLYRFIVLQYSQQTLFVTGNQSMHMRVGGQGACAHRLLKIMSYVSSLVTISTLPMIT